MTIVEFLFITEIRDALYRPKVICKDGFTVSVQFGYLWDCNEHSLYNAQLNSVLIGNTRLFRKSNYKTVELDCPSEEVDIWMEYAVDDSKPAQTKYSYVPIDIAQKGLDLHGGIDVIKTFVMQED